MFSRSALRHSHAFSSTFSKAHLSTRSNIADSFLINTFIYRYLVFMWRTNIEMSKTPEVYRDHFFNEKSLHTCIGSIHECEVI